MKNIKYCLLALLCLIGKITIYGLRIMIPVISCFFYLDANSQQGSNLKYAESALFQPAGSSTIMVGEPVPDLTLSGFVQNGGNKKTLADYRGKYLLIDFWATWCAPCYAKFPLLDSFQKKYADRLQIIAISREKQATVSAFLKKRKLDEVSFSILADDTIFYHVFPHYLVPHMIWVSPAGKVQYITGGTSLTSANLQHWINDIPINPMTKIDFMDYNTKLPIQSNVPHAKKSLQLSRNFYRRIPGLPGGTGIDRTDSNWRRFITNFSVGQLYGRALQFSLSYPHRKLRLNVKDSMPFVKDFANEYWLSLHTYCFEVISPKSLNDTLFANLLLEDLNHNLGYRTTLEKNAGEAWVLYRFNKSKALKPSKHSVSLSTWQGSDKLFTMQCETIGSLVDYLNRQPTSLSEPPLFFDKSGIEHHVDLSMIIKNADDFEALNHALKPNGLVLKKERRISTQIVISDMR